MCLILKEEAALLFVLRSILSVGGKPPFKRQLIKDILYNIVFYVYKYSMCMYI